MQSNVLKTTAKLAVRSLLLSPIPPIIVASIGRSGSSLVWEALCDAVAQLRFPPSLSSIGLRIVSEQAWDLKDKKFHRGVVYKTHGHAHELTSGNDAKVVFIFGSASDAALSVLDCAERYGPLWIEQHFEHLRANGSLAELGYRDVLRFGEQLDGWIGKVGTQRLLLHYDALWECEEELSNFVGAPVRLPERRERRGGMSLSKEIIAQYRRTYEALDERISRMQRCQILD